MRFWRVSGGWRERESVLSSWDSAAPMQFIASEDVLAQELALGVANECKC